MSKLEKAKIVSYIMTALCYVVAKICCFKVVGMPTIAYPVIYSVFWGTQGFTWDANYDYVLEQVIPRLSGLIFLGFAIVFALIAYVLKALCAAEYKWK